jgi:hypothetical protein
MRLSLGQSGEVVQSVAPDATPAAAVPVAPDHAKWIMWGVILLGAVALISSLKSNRR